MKYSLEIDNSAYRVFKKLPLKIQQELINKAQILKQNPLKGNPLKGKYSLLRSLHLKIKGIDYRIIYQIFKTKQRIIIRLATTRENIYKRLEEMGV